MWAITAHRSSSPMNFLVRRLTRIVPLYWAVTTFIIFTLLFAPGLMMSGHFELMRAIGSYIFVALPTPSGWGFPFLIVGWTLNIEMMFYVIFAFCLFLPKKFRLLGVTLSFAMVVFLGRYLVAIYPYADRYVSSIVFEFVFGMLIAEIYQAGYLEKMRPAVAGAMILAGVFAFTFALPDSANRAVLIGLPAALVFAGVLALDKQFKRHKLRWLESIGDSSYSLYLTHLITLSAFYQLWHKLGIERVIGSIWVFGVCAMLATIVAAEFVYRLLEMPLTNFFQKKFSQAFTPKLLLPVVPV